MKAQTLVPLAAAAAAQLLVVGNIAAAFAFQQKPPVETLVTVPVVAEIEQVECVRQDPVPYEPVTYQVPLDAELQSYTEKMCDLYDVPLELAYYPFRVGWKLGNVAEMSKVIPAGFADFVIYTSAIEHMHPTDGAKSLAECYKVMKPGAKMFLSCPNTPGNGYQTQYRAHVYEWGYDELKAKLAEIGFSIVQEVGLVTSVREMDEF